MCDLNSKNKYFTHKNMIQLRWSTYVMWYMKSYYTLYKKEFIYKHLDIWSIQSFALIFRLMWFLFVFYYYLCRDLCDWQNLMFSPKENSMYWPHKDWHKAGNVWGRTKNLQIYWPKLTFSYFKVKFGTSHGNIMIKIVSVPGK